MMIIISTIITEYMCVRTPIQSAVIRSSHTSAPYAGMQPAWTRLHLHYTSIMSSVSIFTVTQRWIPKGGSERQVVFE